MWGHSEYIFNPRTNYFYSLLGLAYDVALCEENPQVVIYSCFGNEHLKYNNALKIFFSGENSIPEGVSRKIAPDYRECDYSLSHYGNSQRNYYFPLWVLFVNWFGEPMPLPIPSNPTYLIDLEQLKRDGRSHFQNKTRFCSFINNNPVKDRIELYRKLDEIEMVDCYGRLFNNQGFLLQGSEESKLNVLEYTKFSIEYENSCAPGYNTEKLIQAYSRGSIPIYSGGLDRVTFNSRALFYLDDYEDINAMINDIQKHHMSEEAYRAKVNQPLFNNDLIPDRFCPLAILKWLKDRIDNKCYDSN